MQRLLPPLLALMILAAPARAAEAPEAPIKRLYQAYIKSEKKVGAEPDLYDKKLYSRRINAQIAALLKACEGKDICLPDADFLVDGQDYKITKLRVSTGAKSADKAEVIATFENMNEPTRMAFSMVLEEGRWVVDQLRATSKKDRKGYLLTDVLKPNE